MAVSETIITPGARIEFRGLRRTVRDLQRAGVAAEDLSALMATLGGIVAAAAQGIAPRKSGQLAGSIRAGKAKTRAVVRAGGARTPYAGPIEFGWPRHNLAPRAYLRRALDQKRAEVIKRLENEIQRLTTI